MIQVQWLKIYTDIFDNEKIKKLLKNRDGAPIVEYGFNC